MGVFKAIKDVDLGRLHQFSQDFYYTYGRQAEVMGIGGADPDSVMIVQRINAEGDVVHTFARDPATPSMVYKINGRWVPEDGLIPQDRIIQKINIQELVSQIPDSNEGFKETKSILDKLLYNFFE